MSEYNISASQVKAHSQCPKQWWFRYQSELEATKKDSKYLDLGSRVHEAIESAISGENIPPLGHKKSVEATIQNKYEELGREYPLSDDMYEDGLEYCSVAARYISKREPALQDVERRKEYRIERGDISTGVTAILDVVANSEIWDWKTGRIRDETPHEEKIQAAVYMAAYLEAYGEPPDIINFVYLKEEEVRRLQPEDEIWEYMIERAKALVSAKKTGDFPGEPGEQCYWCGYEFWCDDSAVGIGGTPWEEY